MKCQNLFPGKNNKNISVCLLLKILLRVLNTHTSHGLSTLLLVNITLSLLLRNLAFDKTRKFFLIFPPDYCVLGDNAHGI